LTQSITATQSGIYSVTNNNCISNSVTVTVNPLPVVSLNPFFPSSICNSTAAFNLSGGTPTNGIFTVNSVIASVFDPMTANIGANAIVYTVTNANGCQSSANQNITVDACVSINSLSLAGVHIYPNPTVDHVKIEFSAKIEHILIQDLLGKTVFDEVFNGSNAIEINLSSFAKGTYLLKINKTDTVFKVIKD
jgi:hypothetical protein